MDMNNLTHLRIDSRHHFLRLGVKQFFDNEALDQFSQKTFKEKGIASKKLQHKNILVVEDNEDINLFLSSFLSHEGFSVSQASNGLEALHLFRKYDIELIFTDICMPGINGNILCKQFKLEKKLPVIAITSTPWLAGEDFDQVIHKPFRKEEILESIDNHLPLSVPRKILNKLIHKAEDC